MDFHSHCSRSFFGTSTPPILPYSLNEMSELAQRVVERSVSVPGVQPKLSMSIINEARQKADNRLTVVGALGGNYILKPPSQDFKQMPENEHLTMRIAELLGIKVVPSSLIRLKSGELSYITKRIDRTDTGGKIHMLDMFQIIEAFDKYKGSMEKIGKALGEYSTNPLLDKLFLFELTLFSFLTGNCDMHLKNFSMIKNPSGWILAPGYDLLNVTLIMPEDKEELALTLGGKKLKITKPMFDRFGAGLALKEKQIWGVYERFTNNYEDLKSMIGNSFLTNENKKNYLDIVANRYVRIVE
jgi:serine/threonine-protein kinase HipA